MIAALAVYWFFGYLWYTMGFLGAFVVLAARERWTRTPRASGGRLNGTTDTAYVLNVWGVGYRLVATTG